MINARGSASGVKAANAEFFGTDLLPSTGRGDDPRAFRITIAVSVAAIIEWTPDSGTTWLSLNQNITLVAESTYAFDVMLRSADQFNMRTPTVGGATVRACRVDEVFGEG